MSLAWIARCRYNQTVYAIGPYCSGASRFHGLVEDYAGSKHIVCPLHAGALAECQSRPPESHDSCYLSTEDRSTQNQSAIQ